MRFLDRMRYRAGPSSPREADALALRQLSARGADLAKPRHVIHFLYFVDEEAARAAAATIGNAWRASVEPPDESIAEWCVRADDDRIVGPDTVAAFRTWFEDVAAAHGGSYDGWEAAAKP